MVEVVGLGGIGLICFVEEAEAVNVVGFGEVWIDADEELAAGIDDIAGCSSGIGETSAAALGIVGIGGSGGAGELVAGVIAQSDIAGCGGDGAAGHVTIIIVDDGAAVGS